MPISLSILMVLKLLWFYWVTYKKYKIIHVLWTGASIDKAFIYMQARDETDHPLVVHESISDHILQLPAHSAACIAVGKMWLPVKLNCVGVEQWYKRKQPCLLKKSDYNNGNHCWLQHLPEQTQTRTKNSSNKYREMKLGTRRAIEKCNLEVVNKHTNKAYKGSNTYTQTVGCMLHVYSRPH